MANFPERNLKNQYISASFQNILQTYPNGYVLDGLGNEVFNFITMEGFGIPDTASYALFAETTGFVLTSSYAVNALLASASFFATTSSYSIFAVNALSSSYVASVPWDRVTSTPSFVLNSQTSSMSVLNSISSSFIEWNDVKNIPTNVGYFSNDVGYLTFADTSSMTVQRLTVTDLLTVTHSVVSSGSIVTSGSVDINGDVHVSGIITATRKSFYIPHPLDSSKKLTYASLEGPENGIYIRGKLVNSNIIELPDYWTKLTDVSSITVVTTPKDFHQHILVKSIENNMIVLKDTRFLNKILKRKINCFYNVFAERRDIPILEVEK